MNKQNSANQTLQRIPGSLALLAGAGGGVGKLVGRVLCISLEANTMIPAGMDISTDFSQADACDIIIGVSKLGVE